MKRFEAKIALGTVNITVFEDRCVVELVGADSNETDHLFQVPFTIHAAKHITEALEGRLSALHGIDLEHMEPMGEA